jgi:hypothetical protein
LIGRKWHELVTLNESSFDCSLEGESPELFRDEKVGDRESPMTQFVKATLTVVWNPSQFETLSNYREFNPRRYAFAIF